MVVSDTRVGRMDTTPLLKVLKQRHPQIVSVVLASDSDVDAVIELINQGQVYRFIPKPVKPAFLKIMLALAVHEHRELRSTPGIGRRHAVQAAPAGTEERLVKAVQDEAMRLKPLAALAGQRHGARPPRRRPEEAVRYRVKRAPR